MWADGATRRQFGLLNLIYHLARYEQIVRRKLLTRAA